MPKGPVSAAPIKDADIPTPAMLGGTRIGDAGESRMGLYILVGIVAVLVVVYGVISYNRGDRVTYQAVLQEDLGFTSEDDYHAVVRKLGAPSNDRWSDGKDLQYRALPSYHYKPQALPTQISVKQLSSLRWFRL
jgi:hypothetical protein